MPLSDTAIRTAKPGPKPLKLSDSGGLYLLLNPSGTKWWRLDYRFDGKRKTLSMGVYPDVSLKLARERRDEARKQIASGIDPGEHRKATKRARAELAANSFEAVARDWYAHHAAVLTDSTKEKLLRRLEVDVLPYLGSRPISEITAPDLLALIKRIEARGAFDIAKRMYNACGRIFRYAVAHGLCSRDPSRDIELRDVLRPVATRHHASVTHPKEVGALLRAIDGFTGALTTRCALKLAPLVFVRPGELRHAEWTEIDFDTHEWRIPAEKMKMREQHIVPLSSQAVAVLREIQQLTSAGRYVFPSERGGGRPMSENTVNAALRRMGYSNDEMTGHGFRSTASTLLHELGYPHQVIERQLAHGERNQVAAAYNFAEHLPERRAMMQQWADYLDKLKKGADVIPLDKGNAAA
ncbi:tyrosine-type recombinase/integrase [Aromatoleum toluclasticum]|uniref:tyrosine-type recombinase/integrase n=1 Tax=Aromatoleum toluclasticum TaxID=92003 RepID=UPI001D19386C|nr:integrase arm-type DNA-binding domain-containing protein [Aromatoleum toluclasticum]MCC4114656.1 tyrosine-type recombinase/integrase [Aromatoleum toluclasticum]